MKKKYIKYFIFPALILFFVFFLASFHVHGSSIGEFHKILFHKEEDPNLLFGKSRGIRSDEWMAGTPLILSQHRNDFPIVNEDIADGMNLGYSYGTPTKGIFTVFKPHLWVFFIVNNIEFAFSFYWWFKIALLLISFYLLVLQLTKNNILLASLASTLLYFTPFIQWWLGFDSLTMLCFGLFFFLKIIKENNFRKRTLFGICFTYSLIAFALTLYPPFQLPLAWIAFFLGIGCLIAERKKLLAKKDSLIHIATILICSAILTGGVLLLYFHTFTDVISIITKTTYPGERFFNPGMGDIKYFLSGFYDILMQKDSNGAPFANQSEASNFFMLYIFLVPWVLYINIKRFIERNTLDWVGLSLSFGVLFLTSWYLLPLPDVFSKITGLYMVLPGRVIVGIGLANYLLIVNMLYQKIYIPNIKHRFDIIIITILVLLTGYTYYNVGTFLYNLKSEYFSWPVIFSPQLKILAVSILTSSIILFLFLRKRIGLMILVVFAIFSTIAVNPFYKGLDILTDTELAISIQELNQKKKENWVIYGNAALSHYVLANGGHVLNSMHNYPQLEFWKMIDEDSEYKTIYNRFAYIFFSDYEDTEPLIELKEMDSLEINIDPCDIRLQNLKVTYILSAEKMNKICLQESRVYNGIYIYRIIY